jgi:hypothetical protein
MIQPWATGFARMRQEETEVRNADGDVNIEEVMAEVRARIRQRHSSAAPQKGLEDGGTLPQPVGNARRHLIDVRASTNDVGVSLALADRAPSLVGRLTRRLRRTVHSLVVYYVNLLAGRQMRFNRAAASLLADLLSLQEESQARIAELEQEVATMKSRAGEAPR